MSITVSEQYRKRRLANDQSEIGYLIRGTDTDTAARDAVVATAPAAYDGKVYIDTEVIEAGPAIWTGVARYAYNAVSSPGDTAKGFEIGGGTQHITQSKGTTKYGASAPDFKGAIGVDRDSVDGVDVYVPSYTFVIRKTIAAASVTNTYLYQIFSLVAHVNDAIFYGLAAGECLFLGASGSQNANGDYEVEFRFAASLNATDVVINDDITVSSKKGWQYLWILYDDAEDTTTHRLIKKAIGAYVEDVYDSGDLSLLGIGTS